MKKIAMTFATLLLLIALLAVSFAWFANNTRLSADETTLEAGKDISTRVDYHRVDEGRYNGETGRGGAYGSERDEDAPYAVDFYVFMSNRTLGKRCRLYVDLNELIVTRGDPAVPPYLAETTDFSEFTWRIRYAGKQYRPGADGVAVSVDDPNDCLIVPEGNVSLAFQLIYLSDASYDRWTEDCARSAAAYEALSAEFKQNHPYLDWIAGETGYFDYPEFGFSSPRYMNSTFYFDFRFGIQAEGEAENAGA